MANTFKKHQNTFSNFPKLPKIKTWQIWGAGCRLIVYSKSYLWGCRAKVKLPSVPANEHILGVRAYEHLLGGCPNVGRMQAWRFPVFGANTQKMSVGASTQKMFFGANTPKMFFETKSTNKIIETVDK